MIQMSTEKCIHQVQFCSGQTPASTYHECFGQLLSPINKGPSLSTSLLVILSVLPSTFLHWHLSARQRVILA